MNYAEWYDRLVEMLWWDFKGGAPSILDDHDKFIVELWKGGCKAYLARDLVRDRVYDQAELGYLREALASRPLEL